MLTDRMDQKEAILHSSHCQVKCFGNYGVALQTGANLTKILLNLKWMFTHSDYSVLNAIFLPVYKFDIANEIILSFLVQ